MPLGCGCNAAPRDPAGEDAIVNADVMMSLAGLSLAIWLVLKFFRGGLAG